MVRIFLHILFNIITLSLIKYYKMTLNFLIVLKILKNPLVLPMPDDLEKKFHDLMLYYYNAKLFMSKYHINHKHPMFQNKTLQDKNDLAIEHFLEHESIEQTGQKRSDLLFYSLTPTSKGIKVDKVYRDIKADYKGTAKGHFTIIPFLFSDLQISKNYVSNYCEYFNDIIPKHKDYSLLSEQEKKIIHRDHEDLLELKNKLKKSKSIEEIKPVIIACNNIIFKTYMNDTYIKLNIHFTIATDLDVNQRYIDNILSIISCDYRLFDINILFPKNNKVNHKVYQEKTIEIIKTVFPEPLRSQLLLNYDKYIQDNVK